LHTDLVSYYSDRDLRYCLPALFDTVPSHVRVILIDNTSGDADLDWIAQTYPRLEFVRSQQNGGFGYANNIAAGLTDSEYLVFLNPDTIPHAGWLEHLITALETQPNVGMATPKILLLSEPGINTCGNTIHITGISLCRGVRAPETSFSTAEKVGGISGACFVVRRSLFLEIGGFDETFFMYMEDTDLSLRTRLMGYEIAYTPDSLIQHDYALKFNESKIFLQERNRYLMLLKMLKWRTLLVLLPALFVAEIVTWGFVLLRERKGIPQKLRAYAWIMTHWSDINRKRLAAQRLRRIADRQLLSAMVWHLDVRQLGDTLLARIAETLFDSIFAPYAWWLRLLVKW